MAMKWHNLSDREVELSFDSGTRILIMDRRNVAAEIVMPKGQRVYVQTARPISQSDRHRVMTWWGSQPRTVRTVDDAVFEQIISKENHT